MTADTLWDTFQVGSVVTMRSGGLKMTVIDVPHPPEPGKLYVRSILVAYTVGDKIIRESFPPECLKIVE